MARAFEGRRDLDLAMRCGRDKCWMHANSAWLAFTAMQHRHYCGVPNRPHLSGVAGKTGLSKPGPARKNGVGYDR